MTHNEQEIDATELLEFIESISTYIEKPISLYTLGGTALTLLGIKKSTLDIDINVKNKSEYMYLTKIFQSIGFEKRGIYRWRSQEGFAFYIFHSQEILGTHLLEDALEKATICKEIGNIKVYTLDIYDIIISKLARSDIRDLEDIKQIFLVKEIDLHFLTKRFYQTAENSVISFAKRKYQEFLIHNGFKESDIYKEVKKWGR